MKTCICTEMGSAMMEIKRDAYLQLQNTHLLHVLQKCDNGTLKITKMDRLKITNYGEFINDY